MGTRTDMLLHALEYAARGWRVHPVKRDKTPFLKGWPQRASTDENEVRAMWSEHPEAGVGIACGADSNLVVIDVDTAKGGDAGIAELQRRYGDLPETITSRTGSGGYHLYFRYPHNCDVRNKAALDRCKGVDVRANGGFVVAPPSPHSSGKNYEWSGTTDNLADLPAAWLAILVTKEAAATVPATVAEDWRGKLRHLTSDFIANGVGEGERNTRLASAALEMAGANYPIEEARERLWLGAQRCVPPIERDEFERTLQSAYSKQRTPWQDPNDVELVQRGGGGEARAVAAAPATPAAGHAAKPYLSNITQVSGKEDEKITIALDIETIAAALHEATAGHPKLVQGAVFTLGDYDENTVPGKNALRFMSDHNQLFAWIQERTVLNWLKSGGRSGAKSRDRRYTMSLVSRPEFYEHLKATTKPNYAAVEVMPHVPTVDGVFYVPFNLPAGGSECLIDFVNHLNADEQIDYHLLMAAILTPAWGGPPGARPAFIFTSKYGRGTGKTETVERIADIYGGRISLKPDKEDWTQAKSRLLSDESLAARCVMIDNIRHKLAGSELESLITAPVIDGHKMYVGQYSRPNRLTYFLTANTPSLSQDLADRSVLIRIGQQQHDSDFKEWALRFIDENRMQLLADIYAVLRGADECEIRPENRDRWAMWQNAVLAKLPTGDKLAEVIKARRPEADTDLEEAEEVRQAIETELEECGHTDDANVIIPMARMRSLLVAHGVIEPSLSKRGATTWVSNLCGASGPLAMLTRNPSRKYAGRSWLWIKHPLGPDGTKVELRNNPIRGTQGTQGGRYE